MGYTPPWLTVNKIAGGYSLSAGGGTTEDLTLLPNLTDSVPQLKLNGTGSIYIVMSNGSSLHLEDSEFIVEINRSGSDTIIDTLSGNKNIYLKPHGTGKVKFGTYVAGVKADSIGYIEVLDSGGTSRRLMVQSA